MDNSINIGSVANITDFQFKIDIFGDPINFYGKRGATGKMIYDGIS